MRSRINLFLDRVFFSPIDARNIGLFRLLYCGIIGGWTAWRDNSFFLDMKIVRLSWFSEHILRYADFIQIYRFTCAGSLFLTSLGILPRFFSVISCVSFFAYFYPVDSIAMPYDTNIVFFTLLTLALAPGLNALVIHELFGQNRPIARSCPIWPLQATRLSLGLVYLDSALNKIRNTGFSWLYGVTLQNYMVQRSAVFHGAFNQYLCDHRWFCTLLSCITWVAELTFILAVPLPGLVLLLAPLMLMIHAGIYFSMGINFFRFFAPAYLSFLTPFGQTAGRRMNS